MNVKIIFTLLLVIVLITVTNQNIFAQNTPCTAAAAEIGTTTDCSGQLITSGTWTAPGSGIINPVVTTACLPGSSTPSHNYWIVYTVPARIVELRLIFEGKTNGNASVRLQDIAIQIYSASTCTGPFTLLNCFNDAGSTVDQVLSVTPGTTYYFRVFDGDGNSSATSEFNYCIQLTHEGDYPCIAIPISSYPFTYAANTSTPGISDWMTGGCNGNSFATTGNGNDLFFEFTVSANSYVSLQLKNTIAANWTELSTIETVDCANGPFFCYGNGSWEGGLQATAPDSTNTPCRTVYFNNAGTYLVRVDSDVNDGTFTLEADTYTPTGGDACVNAQILSPGVPVQINSNNHDYTIGVDDPLPSTLYCAGTVENTNWFYFQSDGSGSTVDVTVDNVTCNPGYYTFIPGPPGPGGYAFYSAEGQFGIVTSSTGACGGTYTSAAACTNVIPGNTYTVSLPNASVTDYFMIWDGNGGAECKYSISVTNVNPLPIELLFFDAMVMDDIVELKWATATEINNDYFTIERSKDGVNYEVVTYMDAVGYSTTIQNYSTIDENPYPGYSFYRLKQTDFDNKYSYSKAVQVYLNNTYEHDVVIAPNPVSGNNLILTFENPDLKNIIIKIIDVSGRVVYNQIKTDQNSQMNIPVNFSKGIYTVQIVNEKVYLNKKLIID